MAIRLLQERRAADWGAGDPAEVGLGPWIASLPAEVDLPFLHWRDSELAELQDPEALREADAMQRLTHDSFEVRRLDASRVVLHPGCPSQATQAWRNASVGAEDGPCRC